MRQLFGTVALVFVVTACTKPAHRPEHPSATTQRIVIVDAGSSGTRIHVYEPERRSDTADEALLVDRTPTCNTGPPLAQTGPDAVLGLWDVCGIAERVDASTPIRVYATAGMRSLAETDPDRAAQIHADVEAKLRERGYVDVDARTIVGVEEARWAWIAANVGNDGLVDASVGILELGGSSTQVAFVPDGPAAATETLTLDGRSWPLFAVSYLHCGANDARRDLAVASCFPRGCEAAPECAVSLDGTPATAGAGALAACTSTIEQSLRAPGARCPVASQSRPPMLDVPFVLVGNFGLLVRSLDAVDANGEVDLARLWVAAERACATTWTERGEASPRAELSRRSKDCFEAGLTHTLLDVYGISSSTKLRVLDQNPEWALGAAIVAIHGPEANAVAAR